MVLKIAALIRARDEEGRDLAMSNALQALKNDDLEKVGELGIDWSEFNELIGSLKWRQLEGEFGGASQHQNRAL